MPRKYREIGLGKQSPRLRDPSARIYSFRIRIHDYLQYHPWMITAGPSPIIFLHQWPDINLFYHPIHHPHQMIFRDQFIPTRRQQTRLCHYVCFEGYFPIVHTPIVLNFSPFEEGLSIPFLDSPQLHILLISVPRNYTCM
jgi:hypothetical protein